MSCCGYSYDTIAAYVPEPQKAVMQADGNFVIYGLNGAVWNTGTDGNWGGSFLALQDDGNLVLYNPSVVPLWATYTGGGPSYTSNTPDCKNLGNTLYGEQELKEGEYLVSNSGVYALIMQGDGNLVLYDISSDPWTVLWASYASWP